MKNVINVASFTSMKVMIHCTPIKSTENPLHQTMVDHTTVKPVLRDLPQEQ